MRHLSTSGALSVFYFYLNHIKLIVRSLDGTADNILDCKVMAQGYSLEMVEYWLGVLPPTHQLQEAFADVNNPFYEDDSSIGG